MQLTIKAMVRILILSLLMTLAISDEDVSADEIVDPTRKGEISVTIKNMATKEGIPGGSLTLFMVAGVVQDETGGYIFDASQTDFAKAGEDYSSESALNASMAERLAAFAKKKKLTGTKLSINKKGVARALKLKVGLYLLVQEEAAEGYSKVSPFLVSIPQRGKKGRLIYEVNATPKPELIRKLTPTPTPKSASPTPDPSAVSSNNRRKTNETSTSTSSSKDRLPQTGQMWWPVFALAGAGIICLMVGFIIRRRF